MAEECFREARITDELRPGSIKKYGSSIKNFLELLGPKNLTDLNNHDFDHYILEMKGRGAGNARIANVIAAMKWLIARLRGKGVRFPSLDLVAIRKPKAVKKETNYLTEREIAQFLDTVRSDILRRPTVKGLRFMAFVMLLLKTGARIGEALSINRTDTDREKKEILIIGKGGRPRTLFLRDETLYWIDRYLAVREDYEPALFACQDGTARWKQTDAGRSFRRYKDRSGIKKHFVIHTFRHTFTTQYFMKGAGINVVQTALGHSDPVTTLKYYAAAVEKAKVKQMINDRHFDFIPNSVLEMDVRLNYDFNIDHILMGPTGVYTIETKTISKPAKGPCEVVCEGETITVNGFTPDRNPVVQARGQSNWIKGFLKEVVTENLLVQPVVLYPGWFVKPQPKGCDVWVLNPDLLPGFLSNERQLLDKRDIQAIEGCLSVYVRNSEMK